jgi:nucleotide-binding universal stress UspA family protein
MYEKILVPLDGSETAEVVLPSAAELAGRLGSEIILVYVSDAAAASWDRMAELYLQTIGNTTKRAAAKYIKEVGGKRVKIESEILAGHPAQEILDYADKTDAGLIAMSTHGRSGISRWALGSVADKVLRMTKRPVLLVRAKDASPDVREKGMLSKILVPLDGSKLGEAVIPYVEGLASRLKAEVMVLQVLSPDWFIEGDQRGQLESLRASSKDYLASVTAQLKQKGIAAKTEFTEVKMDTVAEEIIKLTDASNADLVAMATHGRWGVSRWTFGSVTDRILHMGHIPVLLVSASEASAE